MLPGRDGFEILKSLRIHSDIPVIMLTARGDTNDRIIGLQLGADDYLPKPFEPAELDVRIKAVLRRSPGGSLARGAQSSARKKNRNNTQVFGEYELDTKQRKIINSQGEIELTLMEFRLLEYFILNANQVISREQLTEFLYGDDFDPDRRSIDILISRLRKKVESDTSKPIHLKTLHGQGYIFVIPSVNTLENI
jgi:DNA-binding response OmpR family regulator